MSWDKVHRNGKKNVPKVVGGTSSFLIQTLRVTKHLLVFKHLGLSQKLLIMMLSTLQNSRHRGRNGGRTKEYQVSCYLCIVKKHYDAPASVDEFIQ